MQWRNFSRRALPLLPRVAAACLALACAVATATAAQDRDDSLYRELGAEPGIARLVDALLDRVYSDPRIAFLFKDADRTNLSRLIREQFCHESGGPCTYSGRSMAEAHSGMGLQQREFDLFVDHLINAMEAVDLPYRTQNRLLKIFAPMRKDVIDQ